jgi:hypothetical protein
MATPRRLLPPLLAALCLAVVLGSASLAQACPSCQQALGSDAAQGDLARGMYYSILFMMAMPFAIVGTFAGFAYRAVQREKRRQAEQAPRDPRRRDA